MKRIEHIRLMALVKRLKREASKHDRKSERAYRRTLVKDAQYTDADWNHSWLNDGMAQGLSRGASELGELIRKMGRGGVE